DGDGELQSICASVELPERLGQEIVVSPAGDGVVQIEGGATATLREVVSQLAPGDTLLLQDGEYLLPEAGPGGYTGLYFTAPGVTMRSVSGDAQAVVIDSAYRSMGDGVAAITVAAEDVALADFTVSRSIFHLIHFWAEGDAGIVHNVRMVDGGQQFIKSSANNENVDDVEISCSQFLMTGEGRDNVWGYGGQDGGTTCYTGGIDTHEARGWYVHDNRFDGIYCDPDGTPHPAHGKFPELRGGMTYTGGLSEHAIHMWDSEAGGAHTIARNRVKDCARGIGIGLVNPVHGTAVINNTVSSAHAASKEHDVGIIVERGVDMLIAHNTVILTHPNAYQSGIEYRWAETSNLTVHANLTNRMIRDRDGAVATETDNVEDADVSWFVDPDGGDLHLQGCPAVPSAAVHAQVPDDLDGEPRSDPTPVGADHCP
ncbi:MAG: hypothetical protein KC468_27810, partial [Myxococcales bacterium]|nr:hypothetical protein [Myxococcales bacterium]